MADFDLGGTLTSIVSNLGGYFMQQQQAKAAMKLAQQMAPRPMQYPGLGYSASPPMIQPLSFATPMPLPATPAQPGLLAQFGQELGLTGPATPCSLFTAPTTSPKPRPQQLVMQQNPVTGRMHFWRHVGSPVLYSGDIAHCRTVERILGRASKRMHRGKRRFR